MVLRKDLKKLHTDLLDDPESRKPRGSHIKHLIRDELVASFNTGLRRDSEKTDKTSTKDMYIHIFFPRLREASQVLMCTDVY